MAEGTASAAPRALFACVYRPPSRESTARGDLLAIAQDFSPRFELDDDDRVSIDVSGLNRLFQPRAADGGSGRGATAASSRDRAHTVAHTIGEQLRRASLERGLRAHVAVAGTRTAAMVLACARPGVTVVARGGEAAALAPLPIGLLAQIRPDPLLSTWRAWGLRTLGDLAALPPADLSARLGAAALVAQAIARGEDVRPLVPALEEERFESQIDLEWPIEGLEPLSFVLTRLLEPLSTRLERRDRGAAVLHVLLRLTTKETCARRLELPTPMRDVRTLRTLALLDLEAHPPGGAVEGVTIVIDPTPGRVLQHTLFARAQPSPEQLSTLIARLGAVMGQDRVGAPARVDSYRPGAFAMAPFSCAAPARAARPSEAAAPAPPASALRRCRHPIPARVVVDGGRPVRVTTDRRGFGGGAVIRAAGPWRVSGDWWAEPAAAGPGMKATGEPPFNRDDWEVSLADGAVYTVFQDRDRGGWFIDAIVD